MPTYQYQCLDCGHAFERFQPMTASPVRKCPECGSRVKKLIGSGAGVIVRGGSSPPPSEPGSGCASCPSAGGYPYCPRGG